jgi:hypothetical protein
MRVVGSLPTKEEMKEGSKGNVRVTERNKEKTEIKKEIRLNE